MFKKFWQAVQKPFKWTFKFSLVSSIFVATVPFFLQLIALFTGDVSVTAVALDMLRVYGIAYLAQVMFFTPWIFLYGGVNLFFQWLFPQGKAETKQPVSKTMRNGKPLVSSMQPVTPIQRRKTMIQATILEVLGENNGHLDIEDVHLLERIHNELLTKTEQTYDALEDGAKSSYERDVLHRFDELEQKVLAIKGKLDRQKERHLDRQLEIIDQVTKD